MCAGIHISRGYTYHCDTGSYSCDFPFLHARVRGLLGVDVWHFRLHYEVLRGLISGAKDQKAVWFVVLMSWYRLWAPGLNLTRKNQFKYSTILTFSAPRLINIDSLLTMSVQNKEKRLWELLIWSPKGKCFDQIPSTHASRKYIEITRGGGGKFPYEGSLPPGDITFENLYMDIGHIIKAA